MIIFNSVNNIKGNLHQSPNTDVVQSNIIDLVVGARVKS